MQIYRGTYTLLEINYIYHHIPCYFTLFHIISKKLTVFPVQYSFKQMVPLRLPTWLCPHTFVPKHLCDNTRLSPHMFLLRHISAPTRTCMGTNVFRHKRVWAQTCVGINVSVHKRGWAQSCGLKLKVSISNRMFF